MELEKSPCGKTTSIIVAGKNHQRMPKLVDKSMIRNKITAYLPIFITRKITVNPV